MVLVSSPKDGTMFDPFMDSGTTAISSIKNKRYYVVGFELNPDYCQMIEQRIDKYNEGEKFLLNAVEADVKITNF